MYSRLILLRSADRRVLILPALYHEAERVITLRTHSKCVVIYGSGPFLAALFTFSFFLSGGAVRFFFPYISFESDVSVQADAVL